MSKGSASQDIGVLPLLSNILQLVTFNAIYYILHFGSLGRMRTEGYASEDAERKADAFKLPTCPYASNADLFPYNAPGENDDRSPCPALNTLANHGFIPRNGRGLTARILIAGLQRAYRLSLPLAAFLTYGGIAMLGQVVGSGKEPNRDGVGFSLRDLARHNRVEHDASLTHPNTLSGEEYAPIQQDPELFDAFVRDARPAPSSSHVKGELSYGAEDIARARIRRQGAPGTRIDAVHQEVARGEVALVLSIFGFLQPSSSSSADSDVARLKNGKLPKEDPNADYRFPLSVVETWWRYERLPSPGWVPMRKTTLLGTIAQSARIRKAMSSLQGKA